MIRHITIHSPQTRILALTGYDIQLIVSAINAGANGCLLRDEERETLIAAVRWTAQHSEGAWLNPAISKSILSIQLNAQKAELTNAETEVVRLLNRRNKLIADHLCISERTVRNYVSTIYSKLNVHSRYEAIEWARTHGYL